MNQDDYEKIEDFTRERIKKMQEEIPGLKEQVDYIMEILTPVSGFIGTVREMRDKKIFSENEFNLSIDPVLCSLIMLAFDTPDSMLSFLKRSEERIKKLDKKLSEAYAKDRGEKNGKRENT